MKFDTGSLSDNELRMVLQQKLVEIRWSHEEAFAKAVVNSDDGRILGLLITIVGKERIYQSPTVYRKAVHVLGYIGGKEAVDALLVNAPHDSNHSLGSEVEEALRVIRNPSSVDQLIEALALDFSVSMKANIAYALGQIRDPKAVPALLDALKPERSELTREAIFALGALRESAVIPILIDSVDAFYFAYPFQVVHALRRLNFPETSELLLARIQSGTLEQHAAGLRLAAEMQLNKLVPVIIESLQHPSGYIRLSAARALGWFGEASDARQSLVGLLLEEPDDEIRAEAAFALRFYRDSSTTEVLIKAIDDSAARVRQSAIHSLAFSGGQKASSRLLRVIYEDPDKPTRGAAIHALGVMRIIDAAPILIELLDTDLDSQVIEALGSMGTEDAVKALLAASERSQDGFKRARIVQALGSTSNQHIKPHLLDAFRDSHERVRSAAVYALRNFQDPDTLPILLEALEDPDAEVRFSAVRRFRERDDFSEAAIPRLIAVMQADEQYLGAWRYEEVAVLLSLSTAAALTLARFKHPVAQSALADWLQDHTLPDFSQFKKEDD